MRKFEGSGSTVSAPSSSAHSSSSSSASGVHRPGVESGVGAGVAGAVPSSSSSLSTRDRDREREEAVIGQSLLSDKAILKHIEAGSVVVHPFKDSNLSTSSYDVSLGKFYFRESPPIPGCGVYNPYSESMVKRVWGTLHEARPAGEWMALSGQKLDNIHEDDLIIWIAPGETILGHTEEFIGGRHNVTTMMKARSSLGRNFIEVCKCAGWGDVGYVNRWTMEITNNSRHYSIPLVIGRRIAQIVFFQTDGTIGNRSYQDAGKYQTKSSIDLIQKNWQPTDMLPRMYLDREIRQREQEREQAAV